MVLFFIPLALMASQIAQKLNLWLRTKNEIKQMESALGMLEEEERDLSKKKEYYQTDEFIQREAREKLGMFKEKDLVFLIPTIPDLSALEPKGEKYDQVPVWKEWQNLFFGRN
ncbi:MAG: septum formation initiator family protein [Patescibacteria group bacterium]|nr:septum formation initiator family protein [Patescibacteria group bacterium]